MDKEIATKPLNLNLELNGIGIERGTKIENIRKGDDPADERGHQTVVPCGRVGCAGWE